MNFALKAGKNKMPTKPKKVDKDWGFEIWLANNKKENYCGKILGIFEGKSTSMHYHVNKHETFYVLEGTLKVDMLADRDKREEKHSVTCEGGECLEMQRGQAHKLIAKDGPVMLMEISTFHKDEDSHRLWK